ncbi:MAG: imidazole glycerol phosphate synthase subunit HisH, partial [Ignavibacteriales bacterium]|nr:imidazole glycerol phosphate synthase subunit HisH [Ignavibacteriales bacterium]
QANKIIFPGVGEASFAMNLLNELDVIDILKKTDKPLLGICLGMQLFFSNSEEGNTNCLNVVNGRIKKFKVSNLKIPHMGWNRVEKIKESKLLINISGSDFFYFANSFYAPIAVETKAITEHGIKFTSVIEKDNYFGVQFHPEKSGISGLKLLKNFGELC